MDAADFKTLLFSFRGRINRAKWWIGLVVLIVYGAIASAVTGVVLNNSFDGSEFGIAAVAGLGVALILNIVALVSGFAVGVKRLHDRNKSGWWILLFYAAPWVLATIGMRLGESPAALLLMLMVLTIYIWAFVEMICLRGTVGPNRYGPDPLESDATQPAVTA